MRTLPVSVHFYPVCPVLTVLRSSMTGVRIRYMKYFDPEQLKTFRKEHNLTQTDIANKIYVSRTVVSNWENGRSEPDPEQLKQLENLYATSFSKEEIAEEDRRKKILLKILESCLLCLVCIFSYAHASLLSIGILTVCIVFLCKKNVPATWFVFVVGVLIFTVLHYMEIHYGFLLRAPLYTTFVPSVTKGLL